MILARSGVNFPSCGCRAMARPAAGDRVAVAPGRVALDQVAVVVAVAVAVVVVVVVAVAVVLWIRLWAILANPPAPRP